MNCSLVYSTYGNVKALRDEWKKRSQVLASNLYRRMVFAHFVRKRTTSPPEPYTATSHFFLSGHSSWGDEHRPPMMAARQADGTWTEHFPKPGKALLFTAQGGELPPITKSPRRWAHPTSRRVQGGELLDHPVPLIWLLPSLSASSLHRFFFPGQRRAINRSSRSWNEKMYVP
jgi:hypothetical protein